MKPIFCSLFLVLTVLLTGCFQSESELVEMDPPIPSEQEEETREDKVDQTPDQKSTNEEEIPEQELTLEETADEIVFLLKEQDMETLAKFVHPTEGVRFSPYGYVDVENNLVFSNEQVEGLWEDETVYHWGYFDGNGNPIEATFPEYYDRFVYDKDYLNAEKTAINERLGQGNTLDNTQDVYPGASVVEYHFSGFEEQYEGMDWRSLRLVLIEKDEKWYLVSIVHDEWTI